MEESKEINNWRTILRNTAYIIAALLIFLFALDLMISSLQQLGQSAAETIILATSNPFTGLFIGLLITAIIQSSSTTTAMVVALVASGSISISGAMPIIMGANVGTTITSTIISLGFITKKKEFRRAVSAGTFHDFFNILTVVILFPLEYYYGFLSGVSQFIATRFFNEPTDPITTGFSLLGSGFNPVITFLVSSINNGFLLVVIAFALLFGSILFFRKVLSDMLGFESQDRFQKFFFRSPIKSFGWGLLTTAAIRSSTITTSLVVPLVAKRVIKLKAALPFIVGANMGTTVTAFIASSFNSNAAISIAIAHFLFNFIGAMFFLLIPYLKDIPHNLATRLGRLTLRYRLAGFLYLLLSFFFIPFSLIYFSRNSVEVRELVYQRENFVTHETSSYTLFAKTYLNQPISSWVVYDNSSTDRSTLNQIISVYRTGNLLFINKELFELNKPGFCRDSEDQDGKYQVCIREIIPKFNLTQSLTVDSVYVFEKRNYETSANDSTLTLTYISASQNLLVKKELMAGDGTILSSEYLSGFERQ